MAKKKPKKKRPRTAERQAARALDALGDAKEKLARLSAGGAPERPIEVESASIVESTALALGCARCDSPLRLEGHDARRIGAEILRRVRGYCRACGRTREVWVRIAVNLPS